MNDHIIKTSEQWNSSSFRYKVIPEGVLCIELTQSGKTYIKIGEGNSYFYQLPYVSCKDIDLSDYYTKEEIDQKLINKVTYKNILHSPEELPDISDTGDIYLVIYEKESNKYIDEYMFIIDQFIQLTHHNTNADMDEYATKEYVREYVDNIISSLDLDHIVHDTDQLILYCN